MWVVLRISCLLQEIWHSLFRVGASATTTRACVKGQVFVDARRERERGL